MEDVFSGVVAAVLSDNPKAKSLLSSQLKAHGAKCSYSITKSVTHIITTDGKSDKLRGLAVSVKVVAPTWVAACLEARKRVEELSHAVPVEVTQAASATASDWLSVDSDYWAVAEPVVAAEAPEEPAQQTPEEPTKVKRIVMGRNGQVRYIYSDASVVSVTPSKSDKTLNQLDMKVAVVQKVTPEALLATQGKSASKALLPAVDTRYVLPRGEPAQIWTFALDSQARRQILGQESAENPSTLPGLIRILHQPLFVSNISLGPQHIAVVTHAGEVVTWGNGSKGRLGRATGQNSGIPTPISSLKGQKFLKVACGETHSLALSESGAVYIFGASGSFSSLEPVQVDLSQLQPSEKAISLFAGKNSSALLSSRHRLYTWGANTSHLLGHFGSTKNVSLPSLVRLNDDVESVAFGAEHTLVMTTSGKLLVWGAGVGTGTKSLDLVKTPTLLPLATVTHISACGYRSACVAGGEGFVWGRGSSGVADLLQPFKLNFRDLKSALLAGDGVVALTLSGSVVQWSWAAALEGEPPVTVPMKEAIDLQTSFLRSGLSELLAVGSFAVALTQGSADLALKFASLGSLPELRALLESRDGHFDFATPEGFGLFHAAALSGPGKALPVFHYLFELLSATTNNSLRHFTVNATNAQGQSALHIAAATGDPDSVSLLINHDAKVDVTDTDGNTPLHVAAFFGRLEVVDKLVREGLCELDLFNLSQHTPFHIAAQHNHKKVAARLANYGAIVSAGEFADLPQGTPVKIWISHDNAQAHLADGLQKELARSGVKSSIDKWKFSSQIHRWAQDFTSLLFVITAESIKNERCLEELHDAFTHDVQIYGLVYEDIDIPTVILKFLRKVVSLVPPEVRQRRLQAERRVKQVDQRAALLEESPMASFEPIEIDSMDSTEADLLLAEDRQIIASEVWKGYNNTYARLPAEVLKKIASLLRSSARPENIKRMQPPSLDDFIRLARGGARSGTSMKPRTVRLFVSSTFRDFCQERELLVRHVFPEIEHYCAERQISFSYVDLRWGITEEMSLNGEVINTCLKEVESCYPFFLGMLGERYGWHDQSTVTGSSDPLLTDTFNNAIASGHHWLTGFRNRSVTELEIIHGVLRFVPTTHFGSHGHEDYGYHISDGEKEVEYGSLEAMFYLRDPSFADSVPSKDRDVYHAESYLAKHKTVELKELIKSLDLKWRGYRYLENFATMVHDDLIAAINHRFLGQEVPDTFQRETLKHDAFSANRARGFVVVSPSNLRQIHNHINSPVLTSHPLVLAGNSGTGKSAFIGFVAGEYKKNNPNALVVVHHTKATEKSALYTEVIRHILMAIKSHYKLTQAVPTERSDLLAEFIPWLQQADQLGGLVLFIDGLDQLDNLDSSLDLEWLPVIWPNKVRVVLSLNPKYHNHDAILAKRQWPKLETHHLTTADRIRIIPSYLSISSKNLSQHDTELLANASPTCNGLFLRIILDELCVVGKFETLTRQIKHYLGAKDVLSLYRLVLARWEKDYGAAFVRDALSLLAVARQGLSEFELLEILQIPHAEWTKLYMALKEALLLRSGLFAFGDADFANAIHATYLVSPLLKTNSRLRIAEYFARQPLSERKLIELPYALHQLQRWGSLLTTLSSPDMLVKMYNDDVYAYELIAYLKDVDEAFKSRKWTGNDILPPGAPKDTVDILGVGILQAIERYEAKKAETDAMRTQRELAFVLFNAAEVLRELARHSVAETLYQRALDIQEKLLAIVDAGGQKEQDFAAEENQLGQTLVEAQAATYDGAGWLYKTLTKYNQAGRCAEKSIELLESIGENRSLAATYVLIGALCNYSSILGKMVKLQEAEEAGLKALAMAEKSLNPLDLEISRVHNTLSIVYKKQKRWNDAEAAERKSLKLREKVLGPSHPYVAYSLNNLANLYAKTKNFAAAMPVYLRVLQIAIDVFGANNPFVAQTKYNIGKMLVKENKLTKGREYLNQAYELARAVYSNRHILVKKIAGKILESHNHASEKELLDKIAGVISTTVAFGLREQVLAWQDGQIVAARTQKAVVYSQPAPQKWMPRIITEAEREVLEAAKNRMYGIGLSTTTQEPDEPAYASESSDEYWEAAESSDEDMGFGLFE